MARNNDQMPNVKTGYWCDTYRNQNDESLQTCLEKYGYTTVITNVGPLEVDIEMHILQIYTCACRCLENCWTFRAGSPCGSYQMPQSLKDMKETQTLYGSHPYVCAYDFANNRQVSRWSVKHAKRNSVNLAEEVYLWTGQVVDGFLGQEAPKDGEDK